MKSFIVNSKELFNKKKNPNLSLSPEKIEKNKKIKKKYLACIWCGADIPDDKPNAKYCSDKCRKEALGYK
jgi:hypothetical protein